MIGGNRINSGSVQSCRELLTENELADAWRLRLSRQEFAKEFYLQPAIHGWDSMTWQTAAENTHGIGNYN
jgi:hypothetical protein